MASSRTFSIFVALIFFAGITNSVQNPTEATVRILDEPEKVPLYPNPSLPKRIPARCGDVYINNSSGIYYKAFEAIQENERCAWIIAVPNAVGYTFDIQYLGNPTNIPGSGQELLFTGIGQGYRVPTPTTPMPTNSTESQTPTTEWTTREPTTQPWTTTRAPTTPTGQPWTTGLTPCWECEPMDPTATTYQPISTGEFNVSDCNIVIITFHSSDSVPGESTGFALQYSAIHTGTIFPSSPLSTHHIMESPSFDFHYPRTSPELGYASYELAAFLFPPSNNIYHSTSKHIWYKEDQIVWTRCLDSLFVYTFNASLSSNFGKWQESGKICGNDSSQYISSEDMNLILFQSDYSASSRGFDLSFFTC